MSLSSLRKVQRLFQKVEFYSLIKLGIIDVYQPLPWVGGVVAQRHNGTLERWRAIETELGNLTGSALDIGCNLGYFTFQMARKGFFSIGIESEALLYQMCNLGKAVGGFDNAVFMRTILDQQFSRKLPVVDVTLFLSVFHHIVRQSGMEDATKLVIELMEKTRKVMFFETGQSNEVNTSWAKYLPQMDPLPKEWIHDYLLSAGASKVKHLGEYETHLSPVRRSLFAVYME